MSFSKQLQAFADKTKSQLPNGFKKVVFDLFNDIVARTPVRDGIARASWRISIGGPDLSNEEGNTGALPDPMLQLNKVGSLSLDEMEQGIFITNTVSYILDLEYGHSQQAPQGMVRVALKEWDGVKVAGVMVTASHSVSR